MLHDVIHDMDPSERFRYAQLLAYLASVDDEITRIEMAFYEQRLGATLLSPERKQQLRESMLQQLDLDAHLAKMQPRSIKLALRDICLMTMADREVDDAERGVLLKVATAAGLSSPHVDQLLHWAVKGFHWMQEGYNVLDY